MKENVLVMGASMNPARYSFKATNMLLEYGHKVTGFGMRKGEVRGSIIYDVLPEIQGLDTVTLYLGPKNQPPYYDYLINAKPKRVIFNPGTENPELMDLLSNAGIKSEVACTLVLLRTNQYDLEGQ
jgi:predicted CoA-binding protein